MASREHARIHVRHRDGTPSLVIEDVGSANGTLVRDLPISPGHRVPISPGDAVQIGSTVLTVLKEQSPALSRRVWSRGYFETRVAEECARAARGSGSFALVRIRFGGRPPWTDVLPVIARCLPPPHVFAAHGPAEYEALLLDVDDREAERLTAALVALCRAVLLDAHVDVVRYPRDGESWQALLDRVAATRSLAGDTSGESAPSAATRVPLQLVELEGFAEKQRIEAALAACASNQSRAAKLLGVSRGMLAAKIAAYDIGVPRTGFTDDETDSN